MGFYCTSSQGDRRKGESSLGVTLRECISGMVLKGKPVHLGSCRKLFSKSRLISRGSRPCMVMDKFADLRAEANSEITADEATIYLPKERQARLDSIGKRWKR